MTVDVLIRILSFIIYIFLINFFFSKNGFSIYFSKKSIVFIILLSIGVILNALLSPAIIIPYVNILITILLIVVIALQHEIPIREILFLTAIFLAIDFISESIVFSSFQSFIPVSYSLHNSLIEIVVTSISTIIEMLLILGTKVFFFKNQLLSQTLTWPLLLTLTSISIISIIILFSFLFTNIQEDIDFNIHQLLIVFGITYINFCTLYLYSSLSKHLQKINQITLQNKALQSEMKYISEIKKSQLALRRVRHDLKNRSLVLLGLIDQNHLDEAKEYLKKTVNSISSSNTFYTNDLVLNYLLNEKNAIAQQNHIKFNIHAFISKQINLDNDILSVLIGNLIDNAIEANLRLDSEDTNKYVTIVIKQFKKDLLIEISNPFNIEEKKTRWRRKIEGLGLKNVESIVERYHGLYSQKTENDIYTVSIVLLNII